MSFKEIVYGVKLNQIQGKNIFLARLLKYPSIDSIPKNEDDCHVQFLHLNIGPLSDSEFKMIVNHQKSGIMAFLGEVAVVVTKSVLKGNVEIIYETPANGVNKDYVITVLKQSKGNIFYKPFDWYFLKNLDDWEYREIKLIFSGENIQEAIKCITESSTPSEDFTFRDLDDVADEWVDLKLPPKTPNLTLSTPFNAFSIQFNDNGTPLNELFLPETPPPENVGNQSPGSFF